LGGIEAPCRDCSGGSPPAPPLHPACESHRTGPRGYDITGWPGYPVLREIREFVMVTWLIQKAAEDAQSAAEAAKRITALRTGASRMDWQPFY
jgi:hypothetical protein